MRLLGAFVIYCLAAACPAATINVLLSPQIELASPIPQQMAHQHGRLLLVYEGWQLAHEQLTPASFYPGIDLSGMEQQFVLALFNPEQRKSLPKWLAALAEEQAAALAISAATTSQSHRGALQLFSVYDPNNARGELFIVGPDQVHRLSFSGDKEQFATLINTIKER